MADDFVALPRNLQLLIDAAFDTAAESDSDRPPPKKRRKLSTSPEPTGGFIVDDAPGGFILPSEEEQPASEDDLIALSLIPTALQILDLPPDDEEVLQVFRNAASGWSRFATPDETRAMSDEERAVSRKDWRAVCAVVVGSREEEDIQDAADTGGGFVIEDELASQSLQGDVDDEDAEEDAYEDQDAYENSSLSSFSDPGEESGSDEYQAGPSRPKSKSKPNRKQIRSETPGAPTSRQRRTALEAYSLFFPSSPPLSEDALIKKRLMYKDIVRVADLLKEKIKADEITEMLSLFSTSPDASLGFDDFTRMMIMAKLA